MTLRVLGLSVGENSETCCFMKKLESGSAPGPSPGFHASVPSRERQDDVIICS